MAAASESGASVTLTEELPRGSAPALPTRLARSRLAALLRRGRERTRLPEISKATQKERKDGIHRVPYGDLLAAAIACLAEEQEEAAAAVGVGAAASAGIGGVGADAAAAAAADADADAADAVAADADADADAATDAAAGECGSSDEGEGESGEEAPGSEVEALWRQRRTDIKRFADVLRKYGGPAVVSVRKRVSGSGSDAKAVCLVMPASAAGAASVVEWLVSLAPGAPPPPPSLPQAEAAARPQEQASAQVAALQSAQAEAAAAGHPPPPTPVRAATSGRSNRGRRPRQPPPSTSAALAAPTWPPPMSLDAMLSAYRAKVLVRAVARDT